jgi:hypothetical protein
MKTFETVHYKDMISNNDVVKLLEDVGFSRMKDNEEVGYILKNKNVYRVREEIEVYLKRGYLNIHLTPSYLNLDLYKLNGPTFYYYGNLSHHRSWYFVKKMKYKKETGMEEFKNFLLLSICRDSFLDPEEEAYQIRIDERHKGFYINEGGHDWYDWCL